MSTVLGDLLVKYKADVSDLTGKVKSVKSELSSVSESAEKSGKSLKKTGEGAKEAEWVPTQAVQDVAGRNGEVSGSGAAERGARPQGVEMTRSTQVHPAH